MSNEPAECYAQKQSVAVTLAAMAARSHRGPLRTFFIGNLFSSKTEIYFLYFTIKTFHSVFSTAVNELLLCSSFNRK